MKMYASREIRIDGINPAPASLVVPSNANLAGDENLEKMPKCMQEENAPLEDTMLEGSAVNSVCESPLFGKKYIDQEDIFENDFDIEDSFYNLGQTDEGQE